MKMNASTLVFCAVTFFYLATGTLFSQDKELTQTGLEQVVAGDFREFRGKKIGLITNQTGVDRKGRHVADLFKQAAEVNLVALFGPEHGIRGSAEAGASVGNQVDSATGLPVYSLYGATRKPTREMLQGIDALVFDIQDVGARFYTYISTMALALEAAAEANIEMYVLDRPNPLGDRVAGPVLDAKHRSFVGIHPIALQHGMTTGELARMFLGERWIYSDDTTKSVNRSWSKLHVIPVTGWRRQVLAASDINWIPPSPNIPTLATTLVYPGVCLLEATNVSEGRGTHEPFLMFGAPWIDSDALAKHLQADAEGIALTPISFTPVDLPGMAMNPKYEGEKCHGLKLRVTDSAKFAPVKFGVALLVALQQLYPNEFKMRPEGMARLSGVAWVYEMITANESSAAVWKRIEQDAEKFREQRQPYLLYK